MTLRLGDQHRLRYLARLAGLLAVALFWLFLEVWKISAASPCSPPSALRFEVVRQILPSSPGFTEGLVYRDGFLYESTGQYGGSELRRIRLSDGHVEILSHLPDKDF